MINVKANSASGSNMLLLGLGDVGGRAAVYALQRGSLPGLRIAALDTDCQALELIAGIAKQEMPPLCPVAAPVVEAADGEQPAGATETVIETSMSMGLSAEGLEKLHGFLDGQFPTIQAMVVVFGLGGETGAFYGMEALRYAKEKNVACGAVVNTPHQFEPSEHLAAAEKRLAELYTLTPAHVVLPCAAFMPVFGENGTEEAFSQGVRWLAECALGFLRPFALPNVQIKKQLVKPDGSGQLTLVFDNSDDAATGIFAGKQPTNLYGQNLDIPTFQRLHLEFDRTAELPPEQ